MRDVRRRYRPASDYHVSNASWKERTIWDAVPFTIRYMLNLGARGAFRVVDIDAVVTERDAIGKLNAIKQVLLGQHVVSHDPPAFPDAKLRAEAHDRAMLVTSHLVSQEFDVPLCLRATLDLCLGYVKGIHEIESMDTCLVKVELVMPGIESEAIIPWRESVPSKFLGLGLFSNITPALGDAADISNPKIQRCRLDQAIFLPTHDPFATSVKHEISIARGIDEVPGTRKDGTCLRLNRD